MTARLSFVLPLERAASGSEVFAAAARSAIWAETELVLVCPSRAALGLDEGGFPAPAALAVVETGPFPSLAAARAAGIRAASAPLVFVAETHAFPEPGCLDALVEAHAREPYAAVAPLFETANTRSPLSVANIFLSYRYMLEPVSAAATVPCYNCCFRRDALLALGDELPRALASGSLVTGLLESRGGRVRREPAARIVHQDVARILSVAPDRIYGGRAWAAARSAHWSRGRRLLALVAAPLVPLLLTVRTVRSPQWAHARPLPRGTALCVFYSAVWIAVGEALAYAAGVGSAERRIIPIELERWRHV